MKRSVFLFSMPAVVAALLLSGCSKTNPQTEPTLSVSPAERTIVFTAAATESYTFTVETNQQQWSAGSDQDWCVVTEDPANKTFTVTALANESETAPPDAAITVSAGDASPVVITATMGAAQYSVYVAGYYININNERVCCYWKNGERFDLEVPSDIEYCGVKSIVVSDGNVYVGGYYKCIDRDIICYWKDGVRVDMEAPLGQRMGDNSYLAIADGSLYVAGDYWDENRARSTACYWKDGARFDCEIVTGWSLNFPRSIAVDEGDVYMVGDAGRYFYWKNGIVNYFEDKQGTLNVYSIAVYDGLLYISGYVEVGSGIDVACYWKGGERVILSEEASWSLGIVVTNEGSVYVLGYSDGGTASDSEPTYCYWKDGIRTDITKQNDESFTYYILGSMSVARGSVYACGHTEVSDQQEHCILTACYWKDGVRVDLEVPAGTEDSVAEYITVVP